MADSRRFIPAAQHAYTLVEVLVVVVAIGILAAVAVPVAGAVRTDARTQSTANTLLGVRTAVAGFRQRAVVEGVGPFPTVAQLTTSGVVLDRSLPPNPFTGAGGVRSVGLAQASSREVDSAETHGWAYHVDNSAWPPVAVFYANCTDPTSRVHPGTGEDLQANEL